MSDDDVVDAEVIDDDVDGGIATEIIDGTAPELDAVAVARGERDEYLDSLRRLQAEFENYRKRVAKQQTDQTGPGRAQPGGEAAARCSTPSTWPPSTSVTPTRPTGGPWWPRRASSATSWPRRASSGSIPMGEPFDPNAHEAVGHVPAEEPTTRGREWGSRG